MSQHQPDAGLSERLKQLHRAQDPMRLPAFDVDDIVRGGRRRRRRRAVAGGATAVAAAAVLVTGAIAIGSPHHAAPGPGPAAPPSVSVAPSLPLVEAGDRTVKYSQAGNTVTARKGGRTVATVTLTDKAYASTSARVELTVTVQQPFALDPRLFVLYDRDGGENTAVDAGNRIRVDAGSRTITLTYAEVNKPEALGWVPQDGEGGVAVWE